MRISDWSSDVCSSDLVARRAGQRQRDAGGRSALDRCDRPQLLVETLRAAVQRIGVVVERKLVGPAIERSEEHTSELQVTNAHLVCRLLLEKKKETNLSQP